MELPKVNIAVIGVVCSSLGGMVWYASEQASIIANLEETVAVLDAQSNTTDKVNMLRDIEQNTDNIDEMIDILAEMQEDMEDADEELWEEFDGMVDYFTQLVKLQSRVAILEKTVEFTRKDGM
tara:strand:- start:1160 stop:1528 length:369 start_codon:yes stop_codon:yes gene_type:complete